MDLPACRQCGMVDTIVRDGLCIECAPSQPTPCSACRAAVRLAEAKVLIVDLFSTPSRDVSDTLEASVLPQAIVDYRSVRAQHSPDCPNQERP